MTNNEKAWLEGIKAFEAGQPRNSCPYEDDSLSSQWYGGWSLAETLIGSRGHKELIREHSLD